MSFTMPLPTLYTYIRDLEIIAGRALSVKNFTAAIRAKEAIAKAMGFRVPPECAPQTMNTLEARYRKAHPSMFCEKHADFGRKMGFFSSETPDPLGPSSPEQPLTEPVPPEKTAAKDESEAKVEPPALTQEEKEPFLHYMESDPKADFQDTLVANRASRGYQYLAQEAREKAQLSREVLGGPLSLNPGDTAASHISRRPEEIRREPKKELPPFSPRITVINPF